MPPRIPVHISRVSAKAVTPSNSTSCIRSFSSTSSFLALGPESPNYIDVPKTRQPSFPPKPRVKGVLPTPRDIFDIRSPLPKESEDFIQPATRDSQNAKVPGKYSKDAEYRLYKQRMAESRKQALRVGVAELRERQTFAEVRTRAAMKRLQKEKRALAMAPPKDVDILTQTSVSKGVRDFLEDAIPSTSRSNISDARRAAFERKMAKHAAVRQSRLHDLYINAREFIVDEAQLDDAIEKEFGTEEQPMGWDIKGNMVPGAEGRSPWNGPIPEGVSDMLQKLKGGEGVGLAKERVKRVAEELTGGKM